MDGAAESHGGNVSAKCGSAKVLWWLRDAFRENVCSECQKRHPDEYQLIPKATCKSEYLLPDSELRLLPHQTKPNPTNPRFQDMKLYLLKHVLSRALSKWGPGRDRGRAEAAAETHARQGERQSVQERASRTRAVACERKWSNRRWRGASFGA